MPAVTESSPTMSMMPAQPAGGVLHCPVDRLAGGQQTKGRVRDDLAEQGARRMGTLAILTAISVVATSLAKNVLQPEMALARMTPLGRLSMLFLILASVGLAALQRSGRLRPQVLLDF